MLPNFEPGQIVVAISPVGAVEIGDVVMFKHDGLEKIKRVAQLRQTKEVYLLGDNPISSIDSRTFGWVPAGRIQGKVVWPRQTRTADYSTGR